MLAYIDLFWRIHDDVIKWKHFPRCWTFVQEIHRSIPRTKASDAELWCFSLICVWIKDWVNNREACDLRRYRAHYDVTVMWYHDQFSAMHTWDSNLQVSCAIRFFPTWNNIQFLNAETSVALNANGAVSALKMHIPTGIFQHATYLGCLFLPEILEKIIIINYVSGRNWSCWGRICLEYGKVLSRHM